MALFSEWGRLRFRRFFLCNCRGKTLATPTYVGNREGDIRTGKVEVKIAEGQGTHTYSYSNFWHDKI